MSAIASSAGDKSSTFPAFSIIFYPFATNNLRAVISTKKTQTNKESNGEKECSRKIIKKSKTKKKSTKQQYKPNREHKDGG